MEKRGRGRPKLETPLIARFWPKTREEPNGCIVWTGARDEKGYGKFVIETNGQKKVRVTSHRWLMRLTLGPDFREDLMVLHHCDNPPCVNPGHLYQGDAKDNVRDMISRGRKRSATAFPSQQGELNRRSKLTEADVRELRRLRTEGVKCPVTGEMRLPTFATLSKRYQVSQGTISAAISGENWKCVV